LLSVIPYCKAAENIIIKQEKLQNYSYNQINEKIIETDLVICNDDNESILTNCQKIMNMDIPKNKIFYVSIIRLMNIHVMKRQKKRLN